MSEKDYFRQKEQIKKLTVHGKILKVHAKSTAGCPC
jgi:hypothetical protein